MLRLIIGAVLLLGLVVLVERYIGWAALLRPWRDLAPTAMLMAVTLAFVSYWTRAMRLYDYFRAEMGGAFLRCFKVMLQHNLLNNLLPMRTGELSFPLLMSRHFQISALRSVPALLWFRLLDLHTLGACALAVMGFAAWSPAVAGTVLTLWLALPLLLFYGGQRWLPRWTGKLQGTARARLATMASSLPQTSRAFWQAWAWTLITWLVKLAVFAWVLLLFSPVSVGAAWMGAIGGDLTSVLPVHGIAGAGTYEAGVVAALLPYHVPLAMALAGAVNLHLFLLGSTVFGGVVSVFIGNKPHG